VAGIHHNCIINFRILCLLHLFDGACFLSYFSCLTCFFGGQRVRDIGSKPSSFKGNSPSILNNKILRRDFVPTPAAYKVNGKNGLEESLPFVNGIPEMSVVRISEDVHLDWRRFSQQKSARVLDKWDVYLDRCGFSRQESARTLDK
jgi:hypothetical protein